LLGLACKGRAEYRRSINEYREPDTGYFKIGQGASDVERPGVRSSEACHRKIGSLETRTTRHHDEHVVWNVPATRNTGKRQGAPAGNLADGGPRELFVEVVIIDRSGILALTGRDRAVRIPEMGEEREASVQTRLGAVRERVRMWVTGCVTIFTLVLAEKRLELLRDLVPKGRLFGVLVNPSNVNAESDMCILSEAGRRLGLDVVVPDWVAPARARARARSKNYAYQNWSARS
jgi:hypothetical protein